MKRKIIQLLSFIGLNSYFKGFVNKVNYSGQLKGICVPVLNCWSCPSALTSCPVGALEIYIKSRNFPFYPLLFIIIPGILFGRFFCGFICPAGFLQELLVKVKSKKIKLNSFFEHVPLFSLVFGVFVFSYIFSSAWFSRYICPMGTLEASIPWLILEPNLRESLDLVFYFKIFFLIFLVLMCIIVYRFFCRVLCPLGFMLGLFNKFAFLKIKYNHGSCSGCGKCKNICPVELNVPEDVNSIKCIRCIHCVNVCEKGCLSL